MTYHNSTGGYMQVYIYPAKTLLSGTAPTITASSLPAGITGSPYGVQLTASGTSPFTWSADSLPDGLALTSSGYLSGTPSAAGSYSLVLTAKNSAGKSAKTLSLTVSSAPSGTKPTISTETLDPAPVGQAYTAQLMASGTPPFTWSVKGNMPDGLSLSSSGLITGTPSKKSSKKITFIAENEAGSDNDERDGA